VTCYFDGSHLVGIDDWSFNIGRWCMKKPPADWQPRPPVFLQEAERAWLAYRTAALHRQRHTVQKMAARPAAETVLVKRCAVPLTVSYFRSRKPLGMFQR
jgi:hypothetical protein